MVGEYFFDILCPKIGSPKSQNIENKPFQPLTRTEPKTMYKRELKEQIKRASMLVRKSNTDVLSEFEDTISDGLNDG